MPTKAVIQTNIYHRVERTEKGVLYKYIKHDTAPWLMTNEVWLEKYPWNDATQAKHQIRLKTHVTWETSETAIVLRPYKSQNRIFYGKRAKDGRLLVFHFSPQEEVLTIYLFGKYPKGYTKIVELIKANVSQQLH